jgi:anti-sigma factor RsiW
MDCVRKNISKELDGELDDAERVYLREHLETCADCRAFRASLIELRSIHAGLEECEPPPALRAGILEALEEPAAAGWWNGWIRIAVPAAAALVVFLGVLAGGRLAELLVPSNGSDMAKAFGLEYLEEHPPGSIGELILVDARGGDGDE